MKKIFIALLASSIAFFACCKTEKTTVDCHEMAVKVYQKALSLPDKYMMGTYRGSCLLHSIADLAVNANNEQDLAVALDLINKTADGTIQFKGNFYSYLTGGTATSFLYWAGQKQLDSIAKAGSIYAWENQNRTKEGWITSNHVKNTNRHFIDVVFCTTPYFLYEGLAEGNQEYIDFAANEAVGTLELLYDAETGLEHQGRGWPEKMSDEISKDCWTRGNGWGSMGLQALLRDYPKDGKYWNDIVRISKRFYESVVKYQDPETGLWHQEMTDPTSFIETSGSALILAGLGQAVESGVIAKKYMKNFKKGLKGLMAYVDPDGSVGQTCRGCLCPGKAEKADYVIRKFDFNEAHSFGPVVFALSQAIRMGITSFEIEGKLGSANDAKRPRTYLKKVLERNEDIAWENDLTAYRVYSQLIKSPNASGIDHWAKTVDYSIIDYWYMKDNEIHDYYHEDHGQGCDYFLVGKNPHRGVGGSAVYVNGQVYAANDYKTYTELENGMEKIAFELAYDPYQAGNVTVTEKKTIELIMGTPFFKVTATFTTSDGSDITAMAGLTLQGPREKAEVNVDKERGAICLHQRPEGFPQLLSALYVQPEILKEVKEQDGDFIALFNVKSGEPVVYYAGACAWDQDKFKPSFGRWQEAYNVTTWAMLSELYK